MRGIIVGPSDGGEGVYTLVAEDGEAMCSHYCSHSDFAWGDLFDRTDRKEMFEKKGITEAVGLAESGLGREELIALNKKWAETHEKQSNDTNKPEVVVTVATGADK